MQPRALVVAPHPFFSPRGTPFSVYYRTMVTAELGVQVDLLTYGEGRDVDIPGVRIIRIPRIPLLGPVKIGPSYQKLFLDLFIILWTVGLLLARRYQFVHAHEESIFFLQFLKPIFRFKLVYDMHSSLPEQLTNYRFTKSGTLIGLFRRLEDGSLRRADAVITICPELADYACARMPDPSRHFLIENSIFEPVRLAGGDGRPAPGIAAAAADGGPVIGYAGTFEAYQGLDLLLAAFARVREARPDARLLLVGGSPGQVDALRSRARELGVAEACTFTGRLDQAEARAHMQRADVLVSPRSHGTNTPLKIYEQLASGKPLVATRIPSHTQVLTDDICFLVSPTPEGLAEGLLGAMSGDERCREVVRNALGLYNRAYSRAAYVAKMRQLLAILATSPDGAMSPAS